MSASVANNEIRALTVQSDVFKPTVSVNSAEVHHSPVTLTSGHILKIEKPVFNLGLRDKVFPSVEWFGGYVSSKAMKITGVDVDGGNVWCDVQIFKRTLVCNYHFVSDLGL